MIKFLFKNFKNIPVVGEPIKAAYIGSLVNDVIKNGKESPAKGELLTMGENELESELKSQANSLFEEHITPVITQEGIPVELIRPIKEKGLDKIASALRKKIDEAKMKN